MSCIEYFMDAERNKTLLELIVKIKFSEGKNLLKIHTLEYVLNRWEKFYKMLKIWNDIDIMDEVNNFNSKLFK
uniref:Uncharacterized protein n=1 Tax=Meloidogyne enterolobii TaxID=390850 RepID=A0A6V7WS15_MELEN|nr:unnamed protein product [Meloidogyne enterolobii]